MKKDIIKLIFKEIICTPNIDESFIKKYFHQDYIQYVDGKTLNLEQMINHLYNQKKRVTNVKVDFINLCEENNIIFSNHVVTSINNKKEEIKVKVMAQFTFVNNQIIVCDELTYLIVGDKEYQDLGSK